MQEGEKVDVPMFISQLNEVGDMEARHVYDIEHMLISALCTDGAHHKQWYLYQIAKKFGLDVGSITHDTGIAP